MLAGESFEYGGSDGVGGPLYTLEEEREGGESCGEGEAVERGEMRCSTAPAPDAIAHGHLEESTDSPPRVTLSSSDDAGRTNELQDAEQIARSEGVPQVLGPSGMDGIESDRLPDRRRLSKSDLLSIVSSDHCRGGITAILTPPYSATGSATSSTILGTSFFSAATSAA